MDWYLGLNSRVNCTANTHSMPDLSHLSVSFGCSVAVKSTASLWLLSDTVHWDVSLWVCTRLFYLHRQHREGVSGLNVRQWGARVVWTTDSERLDRPTWALIENDLAVTQVDHYLLPYKCDVAEKVKLIVWKCAELVWYLIITTTAPQQIAAPDFKVFSPDVHWNTSTSLFSASIRADCGIMRLNALPTL